MAVRTILLLLFLYASNCYSVEAITDSNSYLGCWKRIIFSDEEMAKLSTYDVYEAKYQYFCFYPEGRFLVLTMTKDKKITLEEIEKYKNAFPQTMRWRVVNSGVVYIEHKEDPSQNADWAIFIPKTADWLMKHAPIERGEIGMLKTDSQHKSRIIRILERVK